jgi:hypothetical protein
VRNPVLLVKREGSGTGGFKNDPLAGDAILLNSLSCGRMIHRISQVNLAIVDCDPLKADAEYGRLLNNTLHTGGRTESMIYHLRLIWERISVNCLARRA